MELKKENNRVITNKRKATGTIFMKLLYFKIILVGVYKIEGGKEVKAKH